MNFLAHTKQTGGGGAAYGQCYRVRDDDDDTTARFAAAVRYFVTFSILAEMLLTLQKLHEFLFGKACEKALLFILAGFVRLNTLTLFHFFIILISFQKNIFS